MERPCKTPAVFWPDIKGACHGTGIYTFLEGKPCQVYDAPFDDIKLEMPILDTGGWLFWFFLPQFLRIYTEGLFMQAVLSLNLKRLFLEMMQKLPNLLKAKVFCAICGN